MQLNHQQKCDILCVGELLIDFIGLQFTDHFDQIENFKRLQGGSPANLCMNMARLGKQTQLVATLGKDDMGHYLYNLVEKTGVDCQYMRKRPTPTTLVLVTRSKNVSNFEAYRGADCQILMEQFPTNFSNIRLFHTTCFALSKEPAQSNIMLVAKKAAKAACQLSIDTNYAQKIWNNRQQAQEMVATYCSFGALVKVSEVDWERLYKLPLSDPNKAADHFLNLGAKEACITLGSKGCLVASTNERHFLPARKVEVKDTTGAGDAFWSGYLTAWLDGYQLLECAMAGRKMAELKLGHFGLLPNTMNKHLIYEDLIVSDL